MEVIAALQIFAGMLVLVAASGLLIHSLVHISRIKKLKEYLIIFLVLGFATTLPELFIAINATMLGYQELALGNAIGTSIASLSFVAGIIALFSRGFKTSSFFKSHDLTHLSLSVVLLIILASDSYLSRLDGIMLLIVFGYYLWNVIDHKDQFKLKFKDSKKNLIIHIAVAVTSLLAIFFAAQYTLLSAVLLAEISKLPMFLIALVLVAPLGLIPEIIIELELVGSKLSNLTFGDLFTSVVVNSTFIVGIVALTSPFAVTNNMLFNLSALFLVMIMLLFNFLSRSKDELDWHEGLFLIITYFVFIVSAFLTQF